MKTPEQAAQTAHKKVIGVNLDVEQIARLDKLSERHDRPKSYFVRRAVAKYLEEAEALHVAMETTN